MARCDSKNERWMVKFVRAILNEWMARLEKSIMNDLMARDDSKMKDEW